MIDASTLGVISQKLRDKVRHDTLTKKTQSDATRTSLRNSTLSNDIDSITNQLDTPRKLNKNINANTLSPKKSVSTPAIKQVPAEPLVVTKASTMSFSETLKTITLSDGIPMRALAGKFPMNSQAWHQLSKVDSVETYPTMKFSNHLQSVSKTNQLELTESVPQTGEDQKEEESLKETASAVTKGFPNPKRGDPTNSPIGDVPLELNAPEGLTLDQSFVIPAIVVTKPSSSITVVERTNSPDEPIPDLRDSRTSLSEVMSKLGNSKIGVSGTHEYNTERLARSTLVVPEEAVGGESEESQNDADKCPSLLLVKEMIENGDMTSPVEKSLISVEKQKPTISSKEQNKLLVVKKEVNLSGRPSRLHPGEKRDSTVRRISKVLSAVSVIQSLAMRASVPPTRNNSLYNGITLQASGSDAGNHSFDEEPCHVILYESSNECGTTRLLSELVKLGKQKTEATIVNIGLTSNDSVRYALTAHSYIMCLFCS